MNLNPVDVVQGLVARGEAFITALSGALEAFHQEFTTKRLKLIELGHLREAA